MFAKILQFIVDLFRPTPEGPYSQAFYALSSGRPWGCYFPPINMPILPPDPQLPPIKTKKPVVSDRLR